MSDIELKTVPSMADLDMRDYFAAKAMQGAISAEVKPCIYGITIDTSSEFAEYAYKMADAMLAARNANKG